MTRKRVGQGLVEAFSETCDHCNGRGFIVHTDPIEKSGGSSNGGGHQHAPAPAAAQEEPEQESSRSRSRRKRATKETAPATPAVPVLPEVTSEAREAVKATLATIAAAAAHAHEHDDAAPVEEHGVAEAVAESAEAAPADVDAAEVEAVGVETVLTDAESTQGAPEVADSSERFPDEQASADDATAGQAAPTADVSAAPDGEAQTD
jgi:ribonuclease E